MWKDIFYMVFEMTPYTSNFIVDLVTPYTISIIYFYKLIIKDLKHIKRRFWIIVLLTQLSFSYLVVFIFNYLLHQISILKIVLMVSIIFLNLLYLIHLIGGHNEV